MQKVQNAAYCVRWSRSVVCQSVSLSVTALCKTAERINVFFRWRLLGPKAYCIRRVPTSHGAGNGSGGNFTHWNTHYKTKKLWTSLTVRVDAAERSKSVGAADEVLSSRQLWHHTNVVLTVVLWRRTHCRHKTLTTPMTIPLPTSTP